MSWPNGRDARVLGALIGLGIANHVALAGSRVAVALDALSRGASAFTVGALMALFALLPMLFAVAAGRLSDRTGVLRPMRLGSAGLVLGALMPALAPGLPALFASAALVGLSFMAFQVSAQKATGSLGPPTSRARNFSLYAMGNSISGFLGPLIAGLAIDLAGFRVAFVILAAMALAASVVLARAPLAFPAGDPVPVIRGGGALELLRRPALRRAFAINALFTMAWDLHTIFMPIYGAKLNLSALQIGAILATFAAATFVVRVAMPVLMRWRNEHQVLTLALVLAGLVYLAFPFAHATLTLAALSFVLGLGLGSGQPMVMSLLHSHAPPDRVGEALGVRMSLMQTVAVAVPLVSGALGASLGLAPVFWAVGLALTTGGFLSRR
ncbi:MAG: MFS transporter [Casimicrobiaceae bacterium]